MDNKLFQNVWEKLLENRPYTLALDDVFEDNGERKGLAIDLIDHVKLTIWEDGEVSIADFST